MYIVVDSLVIQLALLRTNLQGSEYSLTIDEMLSMMFHVQSIAQYFSFKFWKFNVWSNYHQHWMIWQKIDIKATRLPIA